MGRIIILDIEAEDFLSYHGAQRIELGGRGPMAVVGTNGAGKSTLVSKALAWGLYGLCSPERMGNSTRSMKGRDVIRKQMEPEHESTPKAKRARVTINLQDEVDGTVYTITRTRGRTGSDVIQVEMRVGVVGPVIVDDPTQAFIDSLVGANHEVFVRTCLRGQNDPWNFAEATDGKKREILDSISGANALNEPHKRAKAAQSKAKQAVAVAQARADDADRRAGGIDPTAMTQQADEWDVGRAARVQAARTEVSGAEASLNEAIAHDTASAANEVARQALMTQKPAVDMAPYDKAIDEARTAWSNASADLRAQTERRDHAAALIAAGKCGECGQAIAADSEVCKSAAIAVDNTVERTAHGLVAEYRTVRQQTIDWLTTATATWQGEVDAISAYKADMTPMATQAVAGAHRRLDDILASENPYRVAAEEARKQHFNLTREAAVLRETQREAERQMRLGSAWVSVLAPKGVRAHMAESALAAIEAEANKWLGVLSDGKFSVAFPATKTTQRTKSVREEIQTIIRKGEVELPFLAFSGGEKRRINLAVDLGVAATFARGGALALSLLVLDEEVFSGLDEDGKAAVVTALHHAGVADVVVIDHDPRLSGVLPRTVRAFRGPDGYSRVQEESA